MSPILAFLAGLFLSGLNLYGWRLGLGTAARTFRGERAAGIGTAFVMLLAFLKLPLLIVAGMWFMRQPRPLPSCFLMGFGLVYLALIGWGFAQAKDPS